MDFKSLKYYFQIPFVTAPQALKLHSLHLAFILAVFFLHIEQMLAMHYFTHVDLNCAHPLHYIHLVFLLNIDWSSCIRFPFPGVGGES